MPKCRARQHTLRASGSLYRQQEPIWRAQMCASPSAKAGVTDRHTALDYAQVLKELSDTHFPGATKIGFLSAFGERPAGITTSSG